MVLTHDLLEDRCIDNLTIKNNLLFSSYETNRVNVAVAPFSLTSLTIRLLYFSDARNMARDVHNILLTIVKENGSMSENEAADYVKKLSAKGRYSVDVWS